MAIVSPLFKPTSAITYLVVVYLHVHKTRQSWSTASLCCFLFFLRSRELTSLCCPLPHANFPALLLQFGCWWSSTDTGVILPKARGLSVEVLFQVCRQAAQVSLHLALKIADALHTSDAISPCWNNLTLGIAVLGTKPGRT